jgi:DEAD/DEAH box helicase domain-containing protein
MSSVFVNDKDDSPPRKRTRLSKSPSEEPELVLSLRRLDPLLQFLVRATGKPLIPVSTLQAALPGAASQHQVLLTHVPELVQRGVLHLVNEDGTRPTQLSLDHPNIQIGFPPPPSFSDTVEKNEVKRTIGSLHGCTKVAAKRRLAALKRSLKETAILNEGYSEPTASVQELADIERGTSTLQKEWSLDPSEEMIDKCSKVTREEEKVARQALETLLGFVPVCKEVPGETTVKKGSFTHILPKQASYAGSNAERSSCYQSLSKEAMTKIPTALMDAYGLERGVKGRRRLYQHQAAAIDSAVRGIHTLVCTGTGSGKSLCFLLPVLASAMGSHRCSSLLMFPTKALAQDQMSKLEGLIRTNSELQTLIRPGVIDGDTPHANRAEIAKSCNVILTNPDTLHAAILPGWKKVYRPLLERVKYVVIDEMHLYEGVFGAHVALVLSRMMRLCAVCSSSYARDESGSHMMLPTFLACSATMTHPEHHFRQLCPIARDAPLTVLTADDDGSPRSSKHFFVWNPPIMGINGMSTGRVTIPRLKKAVASVLIKKPAGSNEEDQRFSQNGEISDFSSGTRNKMQMYRRHAADETALLLAKAVANNVRCIAFCKTRSLVEWVYERTVSALRSDLNTEHLASRVESYRGGYTVEARRIIEQRLFKNELLGVVGTSALELGVDIGGIDVTLHCGYPSSHSSLLQQAGRAGRGISRLDMPSFSIMICFNSPFEQQIWRHPKNLLSCGLSVPTVVPLNVGLTEGHMLCAGKEYPLTGQMPVTNLLSGSLDESHHHLVMSDYDLLGSELVYCEALATLVSVGSLVKETVPVTHAECKQMTVYTTHSVSQCRIPCLLN